ncbi:MAG TPA: CoA transferase, partial [Steroidobacteraceae bacterium]|nr:CoA transferase [Steroidobacteraceae bacterium]
VQRGRTGRGALVEVSMLEAMAHFAVEPFAAYFALGQTPTSSDRPRLAQAYILRTRDARLLAIHLSSLEKFWEGLVSALNAPQLSADPRFSTRQNRINNYEALGAELDRHFSQQTLAYWVEVLGHNDVPYAPINSIDQVVKDPQVGHLGLIVPVESAHSGTQAVRPAVQFGGERCLSVRAAPLLNEHGPAIRDAMSGGERWPARPEARGRGQP